jgi:hypothetical protein
MTENKQDRLAKLCARAADETDPDELIALIREINDILCKQILNVQEVIERQEAREKLQKGPGYVM